MPSNYPTGLDAFTTGTLTGIVSGSDHGNKGDALNKIEAELGINPSGSAATVVARLDSAEAFGLIAAAPTGVAATDTANLAAAIAAAVSAGSKQVMLRVGTYVVNAATDIPNDVEIVGQGYSTVIQTATNHYIFKFSPGHRTRVAHLRLEKSGAAQSSGGGFDYSVAGNNTYVDHVYIGNGIHTGFNIAPDSTAGNGIHRIHEVRWNGVTGNTTGFKIGHTTEIVTDVRISDCIGTAATAGDMAGNWIEAIKGVDSLQVVDSLFIMGARGAQIGDSGSGTTVTGTSFHNVTMDQMTNEGYRFATCREFDLVDCAAQGCGIGADVRAAARGVSFIGGRLQGNVGTGIFIRSGAVHTWLVGTKVRANNTANGGFDHGIYVAANATDWHLMGVRSGNVDLSGGFQRYGIMIDPGTSNNYDLIGCDLSGNVTGTISDGGTGTRKTIQSDGAGGQTSFDTDLAVSLVGRGLKVKEGSNARMGTGTLVAGTVVVSTTAVATGDRIFISPVNTGGTAGHLSYTITNGTSFTVTSSSGTDTRTFNWLIIRPA